MSDRIGWYLLGVGLGSIAVYLVRVMTERIIDDKSIVKGYLFTEADCPWCGFCNKNYGDKSGETLICVKCKQEFTVGVVL